MIVFTPWLYHLLLYCSWLQKHPKILFLSGEEKEILHLQSVPGRERGSCHSCPCSGRPAGTWWSGSSVSPPACLAWSGSETRRTWAPRHSASVCWGWCRWCRCHRSRGSQRISSSWLRQRRWCRLRTWWSYSVLETTYWLCNYNQMIIRFWL